MICKCCGQPIPEVDDYGLKLSARGQLILKAVQKRSAGVATEHLITLVWGGTKEGPPLFARQSLRVSICHMNKKLKAVGKEIRGSSDLQVYKLQGVKQ